MTRRPRLSPGALRAELSYRSVQAEASGLREVGFSRVPGVLFAEDDEGGHGNFLRASYRRIAADPEWARRLEKSYTGARHLPRAGDRWRGELECASSSDALLMNVFCYPGVLRRPNVCALLGVEAGQRPSFGVRAELPMRNGEVDRTELDMSVGSVMVEAKLTETGFGRASRERLMRYEGVEEVFDIAELPRSGAAIAGYQLVRGLLAAVQREGCYLVLMDGRRADLEEVCFRVLGAVRSAEVRSRMQLRTWQELAAVLPPVLQRFLGEKYGVALVQEGSSGVDCEE